MSRIKKPHVSKRIKDVSKGNKNKLMLRVNKQKIMLDLYYFNSCEYNRKGSNISDPHI